MRHNGTDLIALACILGGGVVAGGVTLALASSSELPSLECATTVGHDADVVASFGGGDLVVVTPDVRVQEMRDCMAAEAGPDAAVRVADVVELDRMELVDRAREEVDRLREGAERTRHEADKVRHEVDRVRERMRRTQADRLSERFQELDDRVRERQDRAREMAQRARLADGLTIELPDRVFEFRYEQPEGFEGIDSFEDAIRLELQILRSMELRLEGLDEDLEAELRLRLDEKIEELEERLVRMEGEDGR